MGAGFFVPPGFACCANAAGASLPHGFLEQSLAFVTHLSEIALCRAQGLAISKSGQHMGSSI